MRFEQLDVWKRACRLSCDVYKELKNCRDYGLRDQMSRAAVSIPSNIADKSAGATFERCDFSVDLEEVRYMDVPSKGRNVSRMQSPQDFFILQKAHLGN